MMGMIVDEEKKKEERKEEKKEEEGSRRDSMESLEISEEAGEELQDDSSPLPVTSSRPRAAGLRRPMRTMDGERLKEGKGMVKENMPVHYASREGKILLKNINIERSSDTTLQVG